MTNWAFFAQVYNLIIGPVTAQMQAMLGQMCTTMEPIAVAMTLVWMGFVGFDIANGSKSAQAAIKDFFIAGMVVGALQVGQYTQYVADFFLQGVPNTLAQALGAPAGANPAAGLDTVVNTAVTATFKIYEALPSMSFKAIGLSIVVLAMLALDAVCIAFAFGVFMIAAMLNVLMVVVGPVFLALGAIPFTRKFASGWLGVLVGGLVTQLLVVAVMALMTGIETTMLQQTFVPQANGGNPIAGVWGLVQGAVVLILCYLVVKKIPELGQAIGGGVYHSTAGLAGITTGAAETAAGKIAGGAGNVAAAVGEHAGNQIGAPAARRIQAATRVPGASLSGNSGNWSA